MAAKALAVSTAVKSLGQLQQCPVNHPEVNTIYIDGSSVAMSIPGHIKCKRKTNISLIKQEENTIAMQNLPSFDHQDRLYALPHVILGL